MMKSRYIILASLLCLGLFSCNKDNNPYDNTASDYSVNLSGGIDGEELSSRAETLRVISSLNNYNELATKEGDSFKFTLPSGQKQTLFFVANEKLSLADLTAATFNQNVLQTSDYFLNNLQDEPLLYVSHVDLEKQGGETQPIVLSLKMTPVYAKLSFQVEDPHNSLRQIERITVMNVPTSFMLSGVYTHYRERTAVSNYTDVVIPTTLRTCYLPEHDPADINKRTTLKFDMSDGNTYYAVVKEPYSSVDDGKIIRAKHYKMKVVLPTPPRKN